MELCVLTTAPKTIANAKIIPRLEAKPQSKNADKALPNPLMKITYGYGNESQSRPTPIWPMTDVALNRARTAVEEVKDVDKKDVYVEMNKLTGYNPRACVKLIKSCKIIRV